MTVGALIVLKKPQRNHLFIDQLNRNTVTALRKSFETIREGVSRSRF